MTRLSLMLAVTLEDFSEDYLKKAGTVALVAGTLLGLAIHKKIPADMFGKIIYAFVGIGGIWIIVSHLA